MSRWASSASRAAAVCRGERAQRDVRHRRNAKNGAPRSAVKMPAGIWNGAISERPSVSAPTTRMIPIRTASWQGRARRSVGQHPRRMGRDEARRTRSRRPPRPTTTPAAPRAAGGRGGSVRGASPGCAASRRRSRGGRVGVRRATRAAATSTPGQHQRQVRPRAAVQRPDEPGERLRDVAVVADQHQADGGVAADPERRRRRGPGGPGRCPRATRSHRRSRTRRSRRRMPRWRRRCRATAGARMPASRAASAAPGTIPRSPVPRSGCAGCAGG